MDLVIITLAVKQSLAPQTAPLLVSPHYGPPNLTPPDTLQSSHPPGLVYHLPIAAMPGQHATALGYLLAPPLLHTTNTHVHLQAAPHPTRPLAHRASISALPPLTTWLCRLTHAPMRLPRGRLLKYAVDSASGTRSTGPSMRTCRRRKQKRCPASCWSTSRGSHQAPAQSLSLTKTGERCARRSTRQDRQEGVHPFIWVHVIT